MVSRDGLWVAYESNESGSYEIYVRPFPDGAGNWQISRAGGTDPVWAPDGGELFFLEGTQLMAVTVQTDTGFTHRPPRFCSTEGRSTCSMPTLATTMCPPSTAGS